MHDPSAASRTERRYRTDIQGLRAIGIALVVVFHLWVGKVSGGVDVFFVVSAYLMTASLVGAAERTGSVDFLKFWGRVALRILPAAATVLLATLIAGIFLYPRTLWHAFSLNALMSALQLENLQLLRDSTDYLTRSAPASPFQQFWALSLQMQFYAVLPFMVLFCALASRLLLRTRYSHALHHAVFGAVALASFAFAVWILSVNPAPHYFNPAARLWEFMVGALCAVAARDVQPSERLAGPMGWLGLLLVLSCGIVLPASAPFPGLAALVPVTGAVLVLLAGGNQPPRRSVATLLSHPLLQKAATLSFTIYLWHWPIYVFTQELTGKTRIGPVEGVLIIALSIIAAWLTKTLVEDSFKRLSDRITLRSPPTLVSRLAPFAIGIAVLLPCLGVVFAWNSYFQGRAQQYLAAYRPTPPLGLLRAGDASLPPDIVDQFIAVPGMQPKPYGAGCNQKPKGTAVIVCDFGAKDPDAPALVLVGGSHSLQWFPALETIAERNGYRLVNITKSACPLSGTYIGPDLVSTAIADCAAWARAAIAKILELKPAAVFTTATRPGPNNVGDYVPDDYRAVWRQFTDQGIRVIAVRDNPRPEFYSAPACIERNRPDPSACDMDRATHLTVPNPLETTPPDSPLVSYIDLSDHICTRRSCPVMAQGVMVYYDNSHLSVPFVHSLTDALEPGVRAVMASAAADR